MNERVTALVHVSGSVQGVFFRQETMQRARSKSIAGWVRNLADGRVEAMFQGNREAVNSMIEWCRIGPPLARVDEVEIQWQSLQERLEGFSIR